jgi:hypothetical protein
MQTQECGSCGYPKSKMRSCEFAKSFYLKCEWQFYSKATLDAVLFVCIWVDDILKNSSFPNRSTMRDYPPGLR